ncbi:MAG: carbon-nitrogen hydrolase family protein, partial [Desulfobacca sp.]|uniref:carbon-nitrogen hydrolase family protein n=1 Tax=Desulfobacca sp. TaxID=2067990 RepID=UPI00404AB7C0
MPDETHLPLAIIHLAVAYKEPAANRERLLALNDAAAAAGAKILLNPELALSGFSFQSREDIRPVTETLYGETVTAFRELARRRQVYICLGLAERQADTDIFYNSAVVLGPQGEVVCHYRKVNAEIRWGCPGPAEQENTFATPWGRMGVLICSDTFYGLMPRVAALRGVRLLLVPANWPPLGLDPREIWRARAVENGFYLAAGNRSGQDRLISVQDAPSCLFDPQGQVLLEKAVPDSQIFRVDLPLVQGQLQASGPPSFLGPRQVGHYGNIYLDLRLIDDLTSHYELPPPGKLEIVCLAGEAAKSRLLEEGLAQDWRVSGEKTATLVVLPQDGAQGTLAPELARRWQVAVLGAQAGEAGVIWATPVGVQKWPMPVGGAPVILDWGPARLAVGTAAALGHPEMAVHLAKSGCDLAVISTTQLTEVHYLVLSVKCLERLALAVAAADRAGICLPPQGHQRWAEEKVSGPGICRLVLD